MRTLDYHTQFDWKPAPFGRIRKVPPFEGARWPAYQRRPQKTAKRRDWTHDNDAMLDTLLDAGLTYAEIARRLGRASGDAVRTHLKRRRMTAFTLRYAVLTARQVADLLGKRCAKSVTRWIEQGWLTARGAVTKGRRIWRVQWDDLMTFLQNPAYWLAWESARITDADLRGEMLALRADEGYWLTQREIAERYHVEVKTVGQWIDKGWLPAGRAGRQNRLIHERDLEGWIPPTERPRVVRNRPTPTHEPGWLTTTAVAARLGIAQCTAIRWAQRGRLPAVRNSWGYWIHERDLERRVA